MDKRTLMKNVDVGDTTLFHTNMKKKLQVDCQNTCVDDSIVDAVMFLFFKSLIADQGSFDG